MAELTEENGNKEVQLADLYPYNVPVAFHFEVSFAGSSDKGESLFMEASGLNAKLETESLTEGGNNRETFKLPKKVSYDNLVLKRGLLKGSGLISWINNALLNFTFTKKTVTINLLDINSKPLIEWNLYNVYPVAMRTSEFKSTDNAFVVETLELSYTYFKRNDKPGSET